jgi:hypothetical protein
VEAVVSPRAVALLREHGNRLYVWADGHACCGGTRFIKSSVRAPDDAERFARVHVDGVDVFVRPANGRLPDELDIDLKGRRRPRVEASWNGCVYLV